MAPVPVGAFYNISIKMLMSRIKYGYWPRRYKVMYIKQNTSIRNHPREWRYRNMKKILYMTIAGIMVFAFVGCGDSNDTADVETEETTTEATVSEETEAAEDTDEGETVFSPEDVSDASIESIQTYGDYLTMYEMITDDYIANYEKVIKGTVLYDEATFQQMKDKYDAAFEEQQEQYGSMKDQKIIGKDELVDFLKEYRDGLQEYVDTLAESL